jgi:hypothetical protein
MGAFARDLGASILGSGSDLGVLTGRDGCRAV